MKWVESMFEAWHRPNGLIISPKSNQKLVGVKGILKTLNVHSHFEKLDSHKFVKCLK
jgi:hypothetical protein